MGGFCHDWMSLEDHETQLRHARWDENDPGWRDRLEDRWRNRHEREDAERLERERRWKERGDAQANLPKAKTLYDALREEFAARADEDARRRERSIADFKIPDRPPGVSDVDWWEYCHGVRTRGRSRAWVAADHDAYIAGYPAPLTEAILRVIEAIGNLGKDK